MKKEYYSTLSKCLLIKYYITCTVRVQGYSVNKIEMVSLYYGTDREKSTKIKKLLRV